MVFGVGRGHVRVESVLTIYTPPDDAAAGSHWAGQACKSSSASISLGLPFKRALRAAGESGGRRLRKPLASLERPARYANTQR
jgi:hypothetical protein